MHNGSSRLAMLLIVAGCLISLIGGVLAWRWRDVSHLPARIVTRWVPPSAEERRPLNRREREALQKLQPQLDAQIVWSSRRSDNHDLYLVDVAEGQLRRLTDHPHVDFGSRFSPDGEWIVFTRSQREWVSFRDKKLWDVLLIRPDGSDERLLVRHGYHPTWGPGGSSVIFQRDTQVIQIELKDGNERVLFDSTERFSGGRWGEPELHPTGRLLALAPTGFGAIVMAPGSSDFTRLTEHHVCQTTWVPGAEELLWVEPKGNGGTRIARGSADGSAATVFMDLPGDRSHEYFPVLSDDGKWMVWGATDEGHEHDRADYEIFLWKVGSPWKEAVRITYHRGNDQWPDIHLAAPER